MTTSDNPTSDYDAESAPPEDDFALTIEAPVADALEQRTPVDGGADGALPVELPDGVNPADALEQARSLVDDDER